MAETRGTMTNMMPCLLDRLTDYYPKAKKESREHRTIRLRQYRDSVLRDLSWLLNTGMQPPEEWMEEFDYVRSSVVNYGVKSLAGVWISYGTHTAVERRVRQAILDFEPRIIPSTLEVKVVSNSDADGGADEYAVVSMQIMGELWALPLPERLFVRTEVDLETGECKVLPM